MKNNDNFGWGMVCGVIAMTFIFAIWFSHDTPKFQDSCGVVKKIELSSEKGY